jgi:hypothetical protein
MISQATPKTITSYNIFDYPVAPAKTEPTKTCEKPTWSCEIDAETLAEELANITPMESSGLPEVDPELFEQVFCWFIA